jgi:hypothetical protein
MTTNHSAPVNSLKVFASSLIDYAGLFPPANLELGQAFHNFVFYRQSEYRWMLNKFIIPAGKIGELSEILKGMEIDDVIPLSVLGTGGESSAAFPENLEKDIENIKGILSSHPDVLSSDVFELRLPKDVFELEKDDDLLDLMISVSGDLEKAFGRNIPVFYETTPDDDYENTIIRTVESIASLDKNCGFKLRTGGIIPSAFPPAEQIAFAIMTCCEFGVPMKCTAGLHHPIRHFNEGVNSYMHGFFNVFGAGILAYTNNLDEEELLEVLNDEDPYEFVFNEGGLEYNEIEITNTEIKEAREKFMVSYGSCSFDEPVDDLKTMELL